LEDEEGTILERERTSKCVVEWFNVKHIFLCPGLCWLGLDLVRLGVGPEPFDIFDSGASNVVAINFFEARARKSERAKSEYYLGMLRRRAWNEQVEMWRAISLFLLFFANVPGR
jgi:hypothetical protein